MKIRVKIETKDNLIEKEYDFDEGKLIGLKGYSVQNTLYGFACDKADELREVDFEILDGELKGTTSYSSLYFEEPYNK